MSRDHEYIKKELIFKELRKIVIFIKKKIDNIFYLIDIFLLYKKLNYHEISIF